MKIYSNTSTLSGYDEGLSFTNEKEQADIALMGSKPIDLDEFPNLKGIFRAGIGKDNVPEEEAVRRGILVRYPSADTIDIIFNETAAFTCNLIFRMVFGNVGTIDPWIKFDRSQLAKIKLLVIGTGNIGMRVVNYMRPFMDVMTFDILENVMDDLPDKLSQADCISLHIPNNPDTKSFIDYSKLSLMKDGTALINTARGAIVDEDALYNEIKAGRLRAAFDVYWQEPYEGKLKQFHPDSFYMTPHIASTCSGFLLGCRKSLDTLIKELNYA